MSNEDFHDQGFQCLHFRFSERKALNDVICIPHAPWTAVDKLTLKRADDKSATEQENEREKRHGTVDVYGRSQRSMIEGNAWWHADITIENYKGIDPRRSRKIPASRDERINE